MLRDPVAENKTNDKNVERTNLPGPTFKDLGDPAREIISEEGIGVNTVGNQQVSGMLTVMNVMLSLNHALHLDFTFSPNMKELYIDVTSVTLKLLCKGT